MTSAEHSKAVVLLESWFIVASIRLCLSLPPFYVSVGLVMCPCVPFLVWQSLIVDTLSPWKFFVFFVICCFFFLNQLSS